MRAMTDHEGQRLSFELIANFFAEASSTSDGNSSGYRCRIHGERSSKYDRRIQKGERLLRTSHHRNIINCGERAKDCLTLFSAMLLLFRSHRRWQSQAQTQYYPIVYPQASVWVKYGILTSAVFVVRWACTSADMVIFEKANRGTSRA